MRNELLFTLSERTTGTVALIITGNEGQKTGLYRFLKEHLSEYGFYDLDLTAVHYTSLYKALEEQLPTEIKTAKPVGWLVNVRGLENSLYKSEDGRIEYSSLVAQLNFERELLFRQPYILVLWISKSFYAELRKKAPDLMHWISKRFVFDSEVLGPEAAEEIIKKGEVRLRGKTPQRSGRISELEQTWEKLCLDHTDKERLVKDKINLLLVLGKEYRKAFDFEKSEEALQKAMALSKRIHSGEEGNIAFELGNLYLSVYRLDKALAAYLDSLHWDAERENLSFLSANYHQIGRVYEERREWKAALENYQKAIEWKERSGNEFEIGGSYHQIGMVYAGQREWKTALKNYQKAIEWNERSGNEVAIGSSYHQIGRVYEEMQNPVKAKEFFMMAKENFQKFNNPHLSVAQKSLERLT